MCFLLIGFNLCCLDIFSRRYIKILELLHDFDEHETNDDILRHSVTSCP
jgi:hypothetical protein